MRDWHWRLVGGLAIGKYRGEQGVLSHIQWGFLFLFGKLSWMLNQLSSGFQHPPKWPLIDLIHHLPKLPHSPLQISISHSTRGILLIFSNFSFQWTTKPNRSFVLSCFRVLETGERSTGSGKNHTHNSFHERNRFFFLYFNNFIKSTRS